MENPWDNSTIEIERLLFKTLKKGPKMYVPEKKRVASHI